MLVGAGKSYVFKLPTNLAVADVMSPLPGEAEMMRLARRLRSRFPTLTAEPYAPRRYPIISTQVMH